MIAAVLILALTVAASTAAAIAAAIRNGGLREEVALAASRVQIANEQADRLGETLRLERVARDRQVKELQGQLDEMQKLIDSYVEPGQVRARLSEMIKKVAEK